MTTYQFIKEYKHHEKYRLSFNELAKETFGIDFEKWYQAGFWNENYICYSFIQDEKVIANVSLNTMELIMNGERQKAIQIGTVMTAPEHRRKGLAYKLMEKVFEDYDQIYDFYFLAANEEAVPLYEKCGFIRNEENKFMIEICDEPLLDKALVPIKVEPEVLLDMKKQSQPLSNVLSAIGDEHVLMFYYTAGFNELIHQPRPDLYTIFQIEGEELHLYDILSPNKINLEELIHEITPKQVKKVICYFTPDTPIQNLSTSKDDSSNWMIRSDNKTFPALARFPKISQT
ncbi:GNAT family N-acetyltransferase [Peribacillus acanthi]|uniref:GNAT family N-acetyltransferase n=1 Tax=Peribacillus acanthi TaxID=2171554 RepID=UPI000D3E1AA9|nr:GNAT family N-acetyltransferase [Peribacillus acanthi]